SISAAADASLFGAVPGCPMTSLLCCGRNGEAPLSRLAASAALPHRRVGGFDVAREALSVEQRESIAVTGEFLSNGREHCWIARKLQCQGLVVRERIGDQLRQADGVEQTAGNAAGESVPRAGQHRHARPECVARGRVRVVIKRIEK